MWSGLGAGLGWLLTYTLNAVVFAYGTVLCVRDMDLPPEQQEYHPGIMVTVSTYIAGYLVSVTLLKVQVFVDYDGSRSQANTV